MSNAAYPLCSVVTPPIPLFLCCLLAVSVCWLGSADTDAVCSHHSPMEHACYMTHFLSCQLNDHSFWVLPYVTADTTGTFSTFALCPASWVDLPRVDSAIPELLWNLLRCCCLGHACLCFCLFSSTFRSRWWDQHLETAGQHLGFHRCRAQDLPVQDHLHNWKFGRQAPS